jgi:hypothetical protein
MRDASMGVGERRFKVLSDIVLRSDPRGAGYHALDNSEEQHIGDSLSI